MVIKLIHVNPAISSQKRLSFITGFFFFDSVGVLQLTKWPKAVKREPPPGLYGYRLSNWRKNDRYKHDITDTYKFPEGKYEAEKSTGA